MIDWTDRIYDPDDLPFIKKLSNLAMETKSWVTNADTIFELDGTEPINDTVNYNHFYVYYKGVFYYSPDIGKAWYDVPEDHMRQLTSEGYIDSVMEDPAFQSEDE